MVVSDDAALMQVARSLAWWGRDCTCVGKANLLSAGSCGNRFDRWLPGYDGCIDHRYVFSQIGYNLKPLDLQGAVGLVQLGKFDEIHAKRRAAKSRIGASFSQALAVHVPGELEHAETSWFGVPVVCPDRGFKEALVAHLEASRIQTRSYFAGNILMHSGYADLGDWRKYPRASEVLDRVFFVGSAPHYTEPVFQYIEKVLGEFKAP
jgi:CDP-6-deoxy-D-xylo-4-hexulose-3-dehydrase